jgi:hypothetical protein
MNSSFIHADIFFYITTIAVVIFTVLLIILFFYIIKIARHLEKTASKIRKESERVIEDISFVRESIEDQGGRALSFAKFLFGSFTGGGSFGKTKESMGRKKAKNKSRKKSEDVESE